MASKIQRTPTGALTLQKTPPPQFTDEKADNGTGQAAAVDINELSPQDALPGKDPIPLDEGDIVVARDTDGSDDRPTEKRSGDVKYAE